MTDDHSSRRPALLLGLAAYLIWGLMPLYFKLLAQFPADRDRRPPHPVVAGLPRRCSRPCGGAGARSAPRSPPGKVLITLFVTALADRGQLAGLYLRGGERPCARRQPRLLSQSAGQRAVRRRPAQGEAEPRADLRLPARRRRRGGAGGRRRLGPVDQPHARDQLRLLRLPAQGRAGRRARGLCGSRPRSSRRSRSSGCLGCSRAATGGFGQLGLPSTCCSSSAGR